VGSGQGSYSGSENPHTITFGNGDITETANFNELTYTLTITTEGQGSVNKYPSPPYHYNDQVMLTANANSGWSFNHWSGDISGNDNPANIYMTSNKAVTAVFTENALPPIVTRFTTIPTDRTSIKVPDNITFAWTVTGEVDSVHFYLNDIDQGEFSATVDSKIVFISQTTQAKIIATGPGGDTPSTIITITVGEGPVNTGFNYAWLLLIIIPIGLFLFDRWLKKKPPFGKGTEEAITINIGDALKKVTGGKKAKGKEKSRADKARTAAKKAGSAAKKALGKLKDILSGPKPPSTESGGEGYRLHIMD
jgi:hypothetical protein